jgi:hypothetical protein
MRALKSRVVVKLGVSRQAVLAPVSFHADQDALGGHAYPWPAGYASAVKRGAVKNLDLNSAPNEKTRNRVKLVHVDLASCEIWQIPSRGRGLTPTATLAI